MEKKISVIIPVYNVEKYLEKCLDSVINQTYKNLEIILVNDGSTDSSGLLCDNLSKKDSRISVYHKENGGLSSARNYGITKSTGEYIGFVDSDDYIDSDMYETLYNNMNEEDIDLSMCGHYDVYDEKAEKQVDIVHTRSIDREEAVKLVLEAKILSVTAVNKLYRKHLFDNLCYEENKIAEDAFIIIKIINNCRKVVYTNEKKYYYVHRENSITTQRFTEKFLDVIEAYEQNYEIVMEKYPKLEYQARTRIIWAYFYVLDRLILDPEYINSILEIKLISYLRKNKLFIIKNKLFTYGRKISFLFLLVSKTIYKKILENKK